MGVSRFASTMSGALTPVCNNCGVALEFDVAEEEYEQNPKYWDSWVCPDCVSNSGYNFKRR